MVIIESTQNKLLLDQQNNEYNHKFTIDTKTA